VEESSDMFQLCMMGCDMFQLCMMGCDMFQLCMMGCDVYDVVVCPLILSIRTLLLVSCGLEHGSTECCLLSFFASSS